MICKNCKGEILSSDVFCKNCRQETSLLSKELNSFTNFYYCMKNFDKYVGIYMGIIFGVLFAILVFLAYFLRNNFLIFIVIAAFYLPLLLLPVGLKEDFISNKMKMQVKDFFKLFTYYPILLKFSLLNSVYFYLLKLICLNQADPILNLVFLVLVLYWPSLIFPLPFLLVRKKMNFFEAFMLCLKKVKETRWQQFFSLFFALSLNFVGLFVLGFGLIITIPFTYALLERYYLQLDNTGQFNS